MDLFQRYGHLLKADGTNQLQRTLPALEEGYVRPDERSLSDLVEHAHRLAAEIRFYSLTGQATGDWRAFLEPLLQDPATGRAPATARLEAALAARRDWPPHLALFVVFLELFRHLQDDLNELPQRHLRHYYEQELQLLRRQAAADDVHVIFELAKNAAATRLPAATVLDAGKDGEGRALAYEIRSELVVSAAEVKEIRRLVAETDRRGHRRFFVSDAVSADEGASWHTFGARQLGREASRRLMTEAELGFAIASPLLRLAEGLRTVRITAALRPVERQAPSAQRISFGVDLRLTGEAGWVAPQTFDVRLVEQPSDADNPVDLPAAPLYLEIELTLSPAAPAIIAFDAALHGAGPSADQPLLRCLLAGEAGLWGTLDGLVVERAVLSVAVEGVRDLVVQNQQGPLTPDQPMPLFGNQPRLGSQFYVGSAEVFSKKLSSLALCLEWQDPPADLLAHYAAYVDEDDDDAATFASQFLADVDLLYDRSWERLLNDRSLFGFPDPAVRRMEANTSAFDRAFAGRDYRPRPELEELGRYDAGSKDGFLRLVLRGPSYPVPPALEVPFKAFGHQAFPRRYASLAIALSREESVTLPNEPYTPALATLALDYTASVSMIPGDPLADEALYVLGPFGSRRAGAEVPARLVPEFAAEPRRLPLAVEKISWAALFLGIADLAPPQNLSLLFQIESGTAADGVLEPGETEWSYLCGDRFKILPRSAVLADGTRGFQQPGLVVLSVGREASTAHTAMPSGLVWLRALIRRPPESASRTRELSAQAAVATFAPPGGELGDYEDHLQSGLAAKTISRLGKRDAAIKSVRQPYASFAGRGPEADADFFRRSSERLRHRGRAVTVWDFERLVLEAFPEVYKVKCLPHSDAAGGDRAGEAALVIVPDLRRTESSNPLEPRAGAVLRSRIEDFVTSGLTTPFFAAVHVIDPVYEHLVVDARVAFRSGLDAGYHAGVLNEELRRFLSPWAYEEGRDVVFGARIYKSEILAFMEGRSYLDYVTDFELYHSHDGPRRGGIGEMVIGVDFVIRPDPRPAIGEMVIGDDFVVGRGVEAAAATRPHAILVSAAEHRITPLEAGEERCAGAAQLGIGYMTVGLDFIVHPE